MIPGISGEELIQLVREKDSTPIMVISAKSSLEDKVKALKAGADDYLTKPFERDEVLARAEAILRRSTKVPVRKPEDEIYTFKNLKLKPNARKALVNDCLINLTAYEFDILLLLVKHPERVFTKEQLYQEIWHSGYYGEDNTINVHVSNIRKKIKEFDEEAYIKTVWGIGFKTDTAEL
jgi:DNA-binding response OmpR family regulator